MGGGVVRNRFRQARYDRWKAALVVKRAKQQDTDKSGYDSTAPSMPDLNTSESDSDLLPGNVDDDPEFSDGDSSSDEAEPVPDNGATVASVQQPAHIPEPEPPVVPAGGDSVDSTVQDDPDATAFLADVSQVFHAAHTAQVSNFLRQRTQYVADVFREESRDNAKMFHFDYEDPTPVSKHHLHPDYRQCWWTGASRNP